MAGPDAPDATVPSGPAGGRPSAAGPGAGPPQVEAPGRLRWRCRRGMRELDILLTRYLDAHYASAPPEAQAAFRDLLECQDPLIHAYCMGREHPPTDTLFHLIQRIIAGSGNEG